jgi:hypothetical protein
MTEEYSVHVFEPLGTPEEVAYEVRAAEGALWTGGRLLMAIFAFAFAGLAFAYFYLRSANNEHLWRPHGVTAPTTTGAAIVAFTVAAAVVNFYGVQRLRRGGMIDWEVAGWTVLLGGLVALGLQCWEFTDLPFFPGSGGYTSVFIGWSVMNCVLLFAGCYWTETLLMRHLRLRKAFTTEGGDRYEVLTPRITRINIVSSAHFWVFIAVIGVFFWIFMYLSV